jgi:hypothetical protein
MSARTDAAGAIHQTSGVPEAADSAPVSAIAVAVKASSGIKHAANLILEDVFTI